MKLDREDLENAPEVSVRRMACYLHQKGVPDLQDWATLKMSWLIDRMVFAGYVKDAKIEQSLYGGY